MNNVLSINANNIRITNNKVTTSPNFRSNDVTKTDVIETHEKTSKELSNGAKTCIGVVSALAIAGGITYAILRKPGEGKRAVDKAKEELGKDWKEAMEFFNIKQLPEHIEFKEAKTLEEALKYGKDVLGIRYQLGEKGWTLDAVNYINKGLTDISNAMKGRANLPEAVMPNLVSSADRKGLLATITKRGKFLEVSNFEFIKNGMDEFLNMIFSKKDKTFAPIQKKDLIGEFINIKAEGDFKALIDKFKSGNLNYTEKWQLFNTCMGGIYEPLIQKETKPINILKFISQKYPDLNLNIHELSAKSMEEQRNELKTILEKLHNEGKPLIITVDKCASPYATVYHEMGHSQGSVTDYIAMSEADKKVFDDRHQDRCRDKEIWNKMREKGQIQSWHDYFLDFFKQENQETALEVSKYAATDIDEFIAETFARKMQGYKFSDKVEALYKKYNGPQILNPPPSKEPIWHFE